MSNKHDNTERTFEHGLTIVELIVALGVTSLIITAIYAMIVRGYDINRRETQQILAQETARSALEEMKPDIRQLTQSDNGSFAIDTATATEFIFYADVDTDGATERVRYVTVDDEIQRGLIEPVGTPALYDEGAEVFTTIATDVINPTIFSYYDGSFTGNEPALSAPIDVSQIRLVQITLTIDSVVGAPPDAFTLTDRVQARNLKDNL